MTTLLYYIGLAWITKSTSADIIFRYNVARRAAEVLDNEKAFPVIKRWLGVERDVL